MNLPAEILLADADILIDYCDSDLTVLKLVSEHIGPLVVLREVLDEVPGISDRHCARLGIKIIRLETALMLETNRLPRTVSIGARLCVLACDRHRWTLVTNDQALRRVCKDRNIPLRWGFGLMVDLVRAGVLTEAQALKVASAIQRSNPTHIPANLIDRFHDWLKEN
jgi:rRNA-processing protein FCF1